MRLRSRDVRLALSTMRFWCVTGFWAIVALGFIVAGMRNENVGYPVLAFAVLFLAGLTTRAPGESPAEGARSEFDRFLLEAAAACAIVGLAIIWLG